MHGAILAGYPGCMLVVRELTKAYGDRRVLRGCDLDVGAQDRVGLVGVNGSGKSTLLGVIGGRIEADGGRVERRGSLAMLGQAPALGDRTVGEVLDGAVAWHAALLADHAAALAEGRLADAGALQDRLDAVGWDLGHKVDGVASRLGCPARDKRADALSGGEVRRVALAAALIANPDLLVLDEPTNHLDADAVEWLQAFLVGYRGAVLLVTHDRYLLEAVAERIVELEQGATTAYEGSYGDYLVARAERQAATAKQRARMLATIAREAEWASRSPAARTTKQKARLQRLDALRDAVPTLHSRSLELGLQVGVPAGVTLVEAHGLRIDIGDRILARDVELVLRPGERIGVVGPNGIGKTTLLDTLRGVRPPAAGDVVRGPRARIGVLDQLRTGLDPSHTVAEAAGGGNDQVQVGDRWVHVVTFLERMAFEREQLGQRTASLSGGERARLLLAKLMLQGASVLLLDEPTNDLDLETLRILEEALLAYDGGALIVTHDRAFLDRVCTSILAFEPDARLVPYASRTQWLAAHARQRAEARAEAEPAKAAPPKPPPAKRRLSYKEQKELDALPERIEALEAEQETLEATLADPATYRERADEVAGLNQRLAELGDTVTAAYARWEELMG
ncbi:MAG: ABC-F family ATP-binding cassette domain-containing protein [Myxococcota bacterium]